MSRRELFVVGTRTFAAEVAEYAAEAGLRVVGLLEPYDRDRVGRTIHGLPVTWLDETESRRRHALLGTGESARRELVRRLEAAGWEAVSLVHPQAHVAGSSAVGTGVLIAPGVVVGACSTIGEHAVLGRGSLIGHHTEIGAFSTLGPGVNVAGNVTIHDDVFIGMGAVVRDHVTVGAAAVVAMGAVVVGDVAAGAQVRGFPARKLDESPP